MEKQIVIMEFLPSDLICKYYMNPEFVICKQYKNLSKYE